MILQLLFDDKFTDYVIEQFAPYRDQVRTVLITEIGCEKLTYSTKADSIEVITYLSEDYDKLLGSISTYKSVIMHGFFAKWQNEIAEQLPDNVKLAWVLWGAEVYDRADMFMSHLTFSTKIIYLLRKIKQKTIKGKNDITVPISILKRADYCLESEPEIFEEVKAYIGNEKLEQLRYSYYTAEQMIGEELIGAQTIGGNVLLGNSATITNNHLSVFLWLKSRGLPSDCKVITPLSYGSPWVRNAMNNLGKMILGKRFYPLLDFLPRYEYNRQLLTCGSFITNHHRPNAFGNVMTALWLGLHVYSSRHNVQTRSLLRMGLPILIVEDEMKNRKSIYTQPMKENDISNCRKIILENYGRSAMDRDVRYIVNELNR